MDTTTIIDQSKKAQDESLADATPAWEMIEAGRYRPRRIRGSYRGRELG